MKTLPKCKKEQIKKLSKLYSDAHKLSCELRDYLLEKGIDSDILADNFNSLRVGDCNSEDFIKWLEEEFDYLD